MILIVAITGHDYDYLHSYNVQLQSPLRKEHNHQHHYDLRLWLDITITMYVCNFYRRHYVWYALGMRDMGNACKTETVIIRLHGTTPLKKKILKGGVFTSFNRQTKFHSHTKRVRMYLLSPATISFKIKDRWKKSENVSSQMLMLSD
jgi:hypothetical protein